MAKENSSGVTPFTFRNIIKDWANKELDKCLPGPFRYYRTPYLKEYYRMTSGDVNQYVNNYKRIFGSKVTDENWHEAASEAMYKVLMKVNSSVISYQLNGLI